MNNAESLELKSETIGALPIINHFIDRLGLDEIIKCAMPYADTSNHIMPHTSIGILLRNIIIGRLPVYGFKEWVTVFDPHFFNLKLKQVDYINDDRIGRLLKNCSTLTEPVL